MNVDAQHGAGVRERRRDVVAVADERDRTAAYRSPTLLKRQEVGDRLTRMLLVGQRVDDVQASGGRRELLERLLREGPDDDRVDPAFEVAGDIRHRFARPEGDVGLQRHHVAAELVDRDFERRAGAKRRLLEEQRHVPAVERVGRRRLRPERSFGFQLAR